MTKARVWVAAGNVASLVTLVVLSGAGRRWT